MKRTKKILLVTRAGLQETFTDKKIIVLLLIIGFILDNGVRTMVNNARIVEEPLGIFEGFIMCMNNWYYTIIFFIGFIFILGSVPRIDSEQILLIYRTGKKDWLFGEILQIAVSAIAYIMVLLVGCMICTASYAYPDNIWSNFNILYRAKYEDMVSDSNRFVDQQVFKYYSSYGAVLHQILLLFLCLTLMGTVILFFTIIRAKLAGIILNMVLIIFVLLFNNYHAAVMWISPFCHSILALHNIFVFKQFSVSLLYSYLYFFLMEGIMVGLSIWQLKNKWF